MKPPALTVALLTYNRLHYFREAIAAVLAQSYTDFELVVLDNNSSDGTGEFVLSLGDPRIRYIRNAANYSTVEFNCLSAYHVALAQRVIVTHDDDVMEPDLLRRQMSFLDQHPEARLVWTRVSDIDQHGAAIAQDVAPGAERLFARGRYISTFLRERLWPMPSGLMLDKTALPKSFGMPNFFRNKAPLKNPLDGAGIVDVLLPARVNRDHAIGYIDEPLLRRRVHTNQFSHAASLSLPGVYLYRGLKQIAKGVPELDEQAFQFDTFATRFQIQEAITTAASEKVHKRLSDRVERTALQLKQRATSNPEAALAGLPILILDHLLSLQGSPAGLAALCVDSHNSSTCSMLQWLRHLESDAARSILQPLADRRIVVFGSAFVAALLVLDAKRNGMRIHACIDSNSNRHGRCLLGVPIQPPSWMRANIALGDVIIISSERDHEHYIEAIIRNGLETDAEILSWKQLIEDAA